VPMSRRCARGEHVGVVEVWVPWNVRARVNAAAVQSKDVRMLTVAYMSSLERAIEREGERAGERRERERLLRRDGDEWERFVRRRREHEDADGLPVRSEDRKARGDDLRMVLSRADMDQLTHKLGNGAGAEKGGEAITLRAPAATAPVRYRAVHYAIPTDEYEELASGAASGGEV